MSSTDRSFVAHHKDLLVRTTLVFAANRCVIIDTWRRLCRGEQALDGDEEFAHIERAFRNLVEQFVRYLGVGDVDAYLGSCAEIARELAYNDISYAKIVRAFHYFEAGYLGLLRDTFAQEEILPLVTALDDIHHQTIAIISEKYFELADDIVLALVKLVELRDNETGGHIERTRDTSDLLALHLGLPVDFRRNLHRVAPLHDIGKVGISDAILLKKGRLTAEEVAVMQSHTTKGAGVLEGIIGSQQVSRGHLLMARDLAKSHHEHYDGTGYPEGLKGDVIPLAARVFAVADVYDALVSKRPYKAAFSHDEAVATILAGKGSQFDPKVVEAFERMHSSFPVIGTRRRKRSRVRR